MDPADRDAELMASALNHATEAYLTNLRQGYAAELAALKQKHVSEVEGLTERHSEEAASLEAKHRVSIAAAKTELEAILAAALEIHDAAMSQVAAAIRQEYESEMAFLERKIALVEKAERENSLRLSASPSLSDESAIMSTCYDATDPQMAESITKAQVAAAMSLVKSLKKTEHAIWFLKPVDAVVLDLPDYYQIIRQPMDLGTVHKKLESSKYATMHDFVADFDLIVRNARLYNGDDHEVSRAAIVLRTMLGKRLKALVDAGEGAGQGKRKVGDGADGPRPSKTMKHS